MKDVGEPGAGEPHARFDGGELEKEPLRQPITAALGKPRDLSPVSPTEATSPAPYPTTFVGTLRIRATGMYTVDWGDGETSWPASVEGKAWPDGEIRHQYISIGSYDVVVTERWTATWQLGPWSGTLRDLQTVGRIEDFPVEQIQAVIIRS